MKQSSINTLASYIDALHPIIYIKHFDFKVIDDAIEKVGENVKFDRIRRITGYLVGTTDRFNNAKRAEEKDRVKHSMS